MTYSPVPELNLLKAFQDEAGYGQYSDGFGLDDYDDKSGLSAGWSKDPDFLARLTPFATATGGGSFYALWRPSLVVVLFGDEGGQHVVARSLPELFQLLTFDEEPSVDWDGVSYYRPDDHEASPEHDAYVAWLRTRFDREPVDDPDAIVAAAQAESGERFAAWAGGFLS